MINNIGVEWIILMGFIVGWVLAEIDWAIWLKKNNWYGKK